MVGCIKRINSNQDGIGVDFGRNVGGNSLDGDCLAEFGWWVKASQVQVMIPIREAFLEQWEKEWKVKLNKKRKEEKLTIILVEDNKNDERHPENFCLKK